MNSIIEEGYKQPDFQNPKKIKKLLEKIEESLQQQKYESEANWSTNYKEITDEDINEDFHMQMLTEPTHVETTKKKKEKTPHTADLLNEITGMECQDFEVDSEPQ